MSIWTVVDEKARVLECEYTFRPDSFATSAVFGNGAGKLAIFSPPSRLGPTAYDELEAYGEVSVIIAPNGFHHLGLLDCCRRYPDAKLFAPDAAAKRIAKKQPSLRPFTPWGELSQHLAGGLTVMVPPKMRHPDVVAYLDTDDGAVWYFNDLIGNVQKMSFNAVLKFALNTAGFKTGFNVNKLIVRMLVKDKKAFKQWLLEALAKHPPSKLIVGHGPHVAHAGLGEDVERMVAASV